MMRYIMLVAAVMLFTASCSKFEDGPGISFRSKENRLIGKWKLTKWTEKGVDVTETNTDGNEIFYEFDESQGVLINVGANQGVEGTWVIEETNVIMDLKLESEIGMYVDKDTLMLKRLTNKEMVVFYDDEMETQWFFEAQ